MPTDDASPSAAPDDAPEAPAPPGLDEIRAQGLEDGRSGDTGSSAYESFLAMSVAGQRIEEVIDTLQAQLDRVEARLEEVKDLRRTLVSATTAREELAAEREQKQQELDDVETSLEAVEEEQAAKQHRGSVLFAALYTVAGTLFIAGDVIMSREIVASALKIRGDVESWIFALGLAMLTVLLKPAYDRLVERRYWEGRSHVFAGVISVCALGALGTLWVLGAFRSAAFANSTRIQRLTTKLTETSDPAAIQQIQAQITQLQQNLVDGPLAYWAFALSGILFAVAGAVCLGIGFSHGRGAYHLRYRLFKAHRRYASKRDALTDALTALDEQIREHRVTIEETRQALTDADDLDTLRERRDTLRRRLRTLRNERAEVRSQRLQSLYRRSVRQGRDGAEAEPPPGDGAPPLRRNASGASQDDAPASYVGIRNLLPHPNDAS